MSSALVVGANSFAGALVPVLPVLAGAKTALASVLTAGSLIAVVSIVLAFLWGMEMKRRVVTNLVTIAAAVAVTFATGLARGRCGASQSRRWREARPGGDLVATDPMARRRGALNPAVVTLNAKGVTGLPVTP